MYINTVETCWTPNHSTSTITLYVIVLNDIKEINSIHVRLQKKMGPFNGCMGYIYYYFTKYFYIFMKFEKNYFDKYKKSFQKDP